MKFLLTFLTIIVFKGSFAMAFSGLIQSESVKVIDSVGSPTSCRLYRKRISHFLQRVNESAMAVASRENRLRPQDVKRILDLLQRTDVPLELLKENILWETEFDTNFVSSIIKNSALKIEIDSTYLHWETTEGLYPDHFQVNFSTDYQSARVQYRMSYMEACISPLEWTVKIKTESSIESFILHAKFNESLL